SVEAEFPAIVINDANAPQDELQCKSQVSTPVNDEIDFRISFDEFDDLKTDSKNDYEKVMPSIPSPELAINCFDDLDFFTVASSLNNDEIDFRISFDEFDDEDCTNEFPAIVYNDAQTSKSNLLTEPILNPQHINEFNLKDETTLSKYDEEEQNVICFNDLFPFNIIYPNDSKSDNDNDDDKVDIEHSSGDLSVKPLPDVINTDVGAYAHGSNKLLEIKYSVYMYQYGVSWGMDTAYQLPVQF
ncbi:hypothetical protein Tco_1036650, partial [Tanacetum coccineum]